MKEKMIEHVADDFIGALYQKFGENGFEYDPYYINGISDKDGVIIQLWLEWFSGSVIITKDFRAEYDTLIFPCHHLTEKHIPIIEKQLELFRKDYPELVFTIDRNNNKDILVYLDQYAVDLNSTDKPDQVIISHLEMVCDIAKECYIRLKEAISDQINLEV